MATVADTFDQSSVLMRVPPHPARNADISQNPLRQFACFFWLVLGQYTMESAYVP